jgi:hypothetical protein
LLNASSEIIFTGSDNKAALKYFQAAARKLREVGMPQ